MRHKWVFYQRGTFICSNGCGCMKTNEAEDWQGRNCVTRYWNADGEYRIKTPECKPRFSGYKDKNGTDICEGDELSYLTTSSHSNMIVRYVGGIFVGEGPFNTHSLDVYMNAVDFIEFEIIK